MSDKVCRFFSLIILSRTALVVSLTAAVLLVVCGSVLGSEPWVPVGPEGGYFLGTVSDPLDASHVIAVTTCAAYGGSVLPMAVFETANGGGTWTKVSQTPTGYLNGFSAASFSTLYAVTGYGCHRSTDSGATWDYAAFPSSGSGYRYVSSGCADPTNESKVYAAGYEYSFDSGTDSFLFLVSTDGGQNWTASSFFSFEYLSVRGMAVSETNPNMIYVCGYELVGDYYCGVLLMSADGGSNWSDISDLVDTEPWSEFNCVAVDPTNAFRVYVGGSHIYYSTTGGLFWTQVPGSEYANTIGIDPSDPSNVYAASYSNVFVSTDYGETWTANYDEIQGSSVEVEVAPAAPSTVFVSTGFGLFKSTDSGDTWSGAHTGIRAYQVPALALAPSQPSTVLFEYAERAVFGSDDSGESWEEKGYFVSCGNICDLLIHPTDPSIALAFEGFG